MSQLDLRLVSSLAKVFPDSAPPSRQEKCWLSTLNGETVSFQVAYLYKNGDIRSWATLRIKAPPEVNFAIRRVQYVSGLIPSHFKTDEGYLSTQSGLYPDLLESYDGQNEAGTNRLPLTPGIWQSCWIDISFVDDTAAGYYPIEVCIEKPDGEVLNCRQTNIEAIPVDLPALDIPRTQWIHIDCLAEYYDIPVFSEKHWEIIESFAAYAVKHGINTMLTPIHTLPLDTEIGGERLTTQLIDVYVSGDNYEFGFEKFERWVDMCKRIGVKYYEMAHLFTQWGAKHAPKIMGTKNGEYVRLFGWETDALGEKYANYLKQMLSALTKKLISLDIADKSFFHISDEPEKEHLDAYRKAQEMVEPQLKGYKIVDTLTKYETYQSDATFVPIPAVDCIDPFLESDIPELWCYYCCAQSYKVPNHFVMLPSFRARILGVLMYKFKIAGFLHWAYNFYKTLHSVYPINPFRTTDADGTFPSGDPFIVYPGKDGKPLGSLRLMVAGEGFSDLRALKLLEEQIGRKAVLELIEDGLAEPLSFSSFPQNEDYLIKLRQIVNKKIGESSKC